MAQAQTKAAQAQTAQTQEEANQRAKGLHAKD